MITRFVNEQLESIKKNVLRDANDESFWLFFARWITNNRLWPNYR